MKSSSRDLDEKTRLDRSMGVACTALALGILLNTAIGMVWFSQGWRPLLVYLLLVETVSFLLPAWVYFWRFPHDRSVFVWHGDYGKILLCFLCGAAVDVAVSILSAWMEMWIPPPEKVLEGHLYMAELLSADTPLRWTAVLLLGAFFVGFCEETLFRGAALTSFARRMNPSHANGLMAALFAIIHMDPWTIPGIFLLGLLFGKVRLRFRTLWTAVAAHAGANAAGIILMNSNLDMLVWGGPLFVSSGLVFACLWKRLFQDENRWEAETDSPVDLG